MVPAAIRHKNPGAMWPGRTATKYGSTKWVYLNDGTGQGGTDKNGVRRGNKIATFDNWEDGIAAQLDLWRTSPNYRNKTLAQALHVWSGGNNLSAYIRYVTARIPTMTGSTVMNDAFWRSPDGAKFLKVQAGHEAGRDIPAKPEDWVNAQKRVFSGVATATAKKSTGSIAAGGAASTAAAQSGLSFGWVIAIGVVIAVAAFVIWKIKSRKAEAADARQGDPNVVVAPVVGTI